MKFNRKDPVSIVLYYWLLLLLSFDCCIFPVSSGRLYFADLLDKTERFVNILESVQNIKYLLSIDKFDKSQITTRGGLWENAEHGTSKDKKKVSNNFKYNLCKFLSFGKLLNMAHQNLILIILKFRHMIRC